MNRLKKLISLLLVLVLFVCAYPPLPVHAETTKEKLDKAKQEKEEIQGKISENEEKKAALDEKKGQLQTQLSGLNSDLNEIVDNINDLDEKITAKIAQIDDTTEKLNEAIKVADDQYEAMKKRIQFMYERGDNTYWEMLAEAGSFANMLNAAEYIEELTKYDRKKLEEYKEIRESIRALQEQQIDEKEELDELKAEQEAEQNRVWGLVNQTRNNISATEGEISAAEEAALAYEAELKEKEKDIAALQKQLAEELRLSQLSANSVWRDISEVSFAEGDRYLLASLIYCEAGGEPYAGQVAVGAVVINRVLSPVFPSTVAGVIYSPKQFSPVLSGRLEVVMASGKATASCFKAADEAMAGGTNVGSCVYFRTPVEGLSGINIGGHVFY
ncbi:MAG: cell wall hydrolase [Lachnospiraceae bacterium]|nr:cell wall hydrolase [Lachnospiraceae bacterium]MBR5943565.1 cell wall hydrolase [Lachnospiraceae bacterium]